MKNKKVRVGVLAVAVIAAAVFLYDRIKGCKSYMDYLWSSDDFEGNDSSDDSTIIYRQ